MDKPTLRNMSKKHAGETTVVSMRMSRERSKDIDAVAAATGHDRNDVLTKGLEFALEHMEIVTKEREDF